MFTWFLALFGLQSELKTLGICISTSDEFEFSHPCLCGQLILAIPHQGLWGRSFASPSQLILGGVVLAGHPVLRHSCVH